MKVKENIGLPNEITSQNAPILVKFKKKKRKRKKECPEGPKSFFSFVVKQAPQSTLNSKPSIKKRSPDFLLILPVKYFLDLQHSL